MNPKLLAMLAAQAEKELAAHHVYLSLSLWAGAEGYPGAQAHFARASEDERGHMVKLLTFLSDYADVEAAVPSAIEALERPDSLRTAFEQALALELAVTDAIKGLASLADESDEQEVEAFLAWFLNEQIESVSQYRGYVRTLQRCGTDEAAIRLFDSSLLD